MSEMIERVAKAKWARRQEVARKASIQPPLDDWDDETEGLREEVRAETRAGFEAMREPTPEMCEAAKDAVYSWTYLSPERAAEAHRAMIDAALEK